MPFGFDLSDVGDLLSDVGSTIYEEGAELLSDLEVADVAAIGAVGASVYFQNEQLKQQEQAMKDARDAAAQSSKTDPISLASTEESVTVDIGESEIVTAEDHAESEKEKASNVGKVRKRIKSTTPKKKRATLTVPQKTGVQL